MSRPRLSGSVTAGSSTPPRRGSARGPTFWSTPGYILTAAWIVLVLAALRRTFAGRWFTALGLASAVLIAAGVLSPLDLAVVNTANFFGYILWSLWLIVFAVLLLRRPRTAATEIRHYPAKHALRI